MPTVCCVLPSKVSSRSELVNDIAPDEARCSTSSALEATRFSRIVGVASGAPLTLRL
jgi:hypothetical protein